MYQSTSSTILDTSVVRSSRLSRRVAFVAAIAAVGATSVVIGTSPFAASAAFDALPYETQFEIDGDTPPTAGQDWATPSASAPNLRDPIADTGVGEFGVLETCNNNPVFVDDNGTPDDPTDDNYTTDELTRVPQGSKLDNLDLSAIPIEPGNVPRKADLCSVYRSWELVFVADAGNPDPNAGQYQFIFYGGWSRPNVKGEIDVLFPLLGADDSTKDDDLIISYDFVDSSDATTVSILDWTGSSWEAITLPPEVFAARTTRGVELHPVSGEALTFGEFAINLTVAGILPENGPCVSLTTGDPMSRTGNSANASMEDIVAMPPVDLTNCGSLKITKETQPAIPASSLAFTTETSEIDGANIQFGDVTSLADTLTVPDDPSVTHLDMLISPDYQVVETNLPDGWTEASLICQSYDPIAGTDVTRTLWSSSAAGPDSSFPIAPGVEATCTVLNVGPPTITVQKTTVGGVGGPFTFEVTPAGDAPRQLTATTTTADSPTVVDQGTLDVVPGAYTIQEVGLPTAWTPDGMVCELTNANGTAIAGTADAAGAVQVDLLAGDSLVCTQSNLAPGSVDVTKSIEGTTTNWSFDLIIDPVPADEPATKTVTAQAPTAHWDNLLPGVGYTITEQAANDNFIHGTVECGQGATFTVEPGAVAACAITNTELANVSVTKTVNGTTAGWSFGFTISPVPAGQTATKTATTAAPTVTWDGLIPGTAYTITEAAVPGYISGALTCGTSGATFTPTPGQDVTCAITNTELANVSVTKTVDPGDEAGWSFDFTIDPVPTGETATKTATSAAPTVTWDGLVPGTTYIVTEVEGSDLVVGELICTDGDNGIGASAFTPTAGQDVSCAIANTRVADIEIIKSTNATLVFTGSQVQWEIEVSNNGPSTALDVVLDDPLPTTLSLLSVSPPTGWACETTVTGTPGRVVCSTDDMAPGERAVFGIVSIVNASAPAGPINNTATVTTSTDETRTDNNTDSAGITVEIVAVLPPTGGYVQTRLLLATLLIGAGIALIATQRRRRPI